MSELIIHTAAIEGELGILALEGSLEAMGATQLKASCYALRDEGCTNVICDLSKVDMISSTGVGALLIVHEIFEDLGGAAIYAALSPEVLSVLRCMDLDKVIEIVDSSDEARRRMSARSTTG